MNESLFDFDPFVTKADYPPYPVESIGERHRIVVNKITHSIRFENETESEVVVVVEPKDETK